MLRVIVAALVGGMAVQGWRQYPPDGPLTAASAMWLSLLGVVLAFFAGWYLGRGRGGSATATATATASAESTSSALGNAVHVNVFQATDATGARPVGLTVPDAPSWRGEAPAITHEQAAELLGDGADLEELGFAEDVRAEVQG